MLISQHRGGHEHCRLLAITSRLEGRTYGHLSLSEAHVTADETIHRHSALHVGFHILRSLQLVGRVLIEEAGLQLVLHEIVGREGKAFLMASLGIELNEVAGNVLNLRLCPLLEPLPCARA